MRELPLVAPAPVVTEHAGVFRELFDHQCQCRHVQHHLTGLIVLPNKSLANRARGLLDSADKTHLSRFLSEAPWREAEVNRRRVQCMRQQTKPHRRRRHDSLVVIDDTRCEPVGDLCDHGDRHDNHGNGTYPLAHNPVTSFSVSVPVRCPLGRRLYRRDEELPQWEAGVAKHVPELKLPPDNQARNRWHQQVDPVWLQDPEFRARHEPFRTHIARAIDLVEEAMRHKGPVGVGGFDAWSLAEEVVQVLARRRTDWMRRLTKTRLLETASVHLRDAKGWAMQLPSPHIAVEERVPRMPAPAYRPVKAGDHPSGGFTRAVRIPGLGTVRLVVSCEHESWTGRSVVRVTNRADWSAANIIALYLQRWPTETFDQDRKGPLGFNQYRMRSADALGKPWCLVVAASALLPLPCLPTVPDRTKGLIHTIGDAGRHQGRALLQKLLRFVPDQWSQGAKADQIFAQLCAKHRGMVPG